MTRSINSEVFEVFVSNGKIRYLQHFKDGNKAQIIDIFFFFFLAKALKKIFVLCLALGEY